MRLVAQGQQVIRYDVETTSPLKAELREMILEKYGEKLDSCDIVVLSDYAKGFFHGDFTQDIIQLAKKAGKPVIVDPKNRDYSVYAGADYVKPNRQELSEAVGHSVQTIDDVAAAAQSLCREHSIGNIIVTLGEDGIVCVPGNGDRAIHDKIEYTPEVFDVSGAGDTVLAVLALSIGCGIEMTHALYMANIAAQIVISKSGTAVVTPEEIIHFVHSRAIETSAGNLLNKIVTLPQAKQIVQTWKNLGETICFTNGCFDLLHYGHISSFLQARKHGDRLIVALNSDESAKKNKGAQRPVQDEKTRAALLALLQCVDLVVVFDEDTPLLMVQELRPDVIAKEGYSLEKWAEARFVQSYGGKVVFLEREDGYSTSELVEKIIKQEEPVR
jgi:D-beta-D-heptose 7-phosphate kinase/D-beta-D-heptose 1-phosphate adenosyltransferase